MLDKDMSKESWNSMSEPFSNTGRQRIANWLIHEMKVSIIDNSGIVMVRDDWEKEGRRLRISLDGSESIVDFDGNERKF